MENKRTTIMIQALFTVGSQFFLSICIMVELLEEDGKQYFMFDPSVSI
jgi:hypothetical protein